MKFMSSFLIIAIIGILAQFIDGGLGMGYGVTSSTLLISLGFIPTIASAVVHTAEVFTTLAAGISHYKIGNVEKKIFIPLVLGGILGGVFGAYMLTSFENLKPITSVILLSMGLLILYRFNFRKTPVVFKSVPHFKKTVGLGFFAAMVDSIGGGGWGPITTPSLVLRDLHPSKVIGSACLAEFFVTVAVSLSFLFMLKDLPWDFVFPLAIGGIIISPIAAYMSKKLSHRILGSLVGSGVIILSILNIVKYLGL